MTIGEIASCFVVAVGLTVLAGTPYVLAHRKQSCVAYRRESNMNQSASKR